MSTLALETNSGSWRKRSREEDTSSQLDRKRPRYYYFRLESESSKASEEDTESICSLQDKETDVVRDTSDTDSKSGCSDHEEYEVHYEEYDVASLTGSENGSTQFITSSDSEDMMLAAAAVICDSSLETWITDCEDSDNSSMDDLSFGKTDFSTCIQCKSENDNPLYRYCEKCFQDRKKYYPPRPKKRKKSRSRSNSKKKNDPPVKLATLQSCLSGLSQDSGIGSSQECPPLDLDQIVVPDNHLTAGTSQNSSIETEKVVDDGKYIRLEDVSSSNVEKIMNGGEEKITGKSSSVDSKIGLKRGRKRRFSESSLSDCDIKKPKSFEISQTLSEKQSSVSQTSDLGSEVSSSSFVSSIVEKTCTEGDGLKNSFIDNTELCILCNDAPKDAIFLHSKVAHQCCCYKCAKRTLKSTKRCPICNLTVNKVFKVIKS